MRLIAGLGNPGKDYKFTRHNLGFLTVQRLAEKNGLKFGLSSFTNGLTVEGSIGKQPVCLLMPLTYMNNSGVAVSQAMKKKDIPPGDLLVVTDDFHLAFQQLRLRFKGSDGGHNGLSSIIRLLGTEEFARLRMGVGEPAKTEDAVDYVLEQFSKKERDNLDQYIDLATDCCVTWLKKGVNSAMDQYNRRT